MFGNRKKSTPEKVLTFVGERLDGHVMGIAKNAGKTVLALTAATVGASAFVNSIRDTSDE